MSVGATATAAKAETTAAETGRLLYTALVEYRQVRD